MADEGSDCADAAAPATAEERPHGGPGGAAGNACRAHGARAVASRLEVPAVLRWRFASSVAEEDLGLVAAAAVEGIPAVCELAALCGCVLCLLAVPLGRRVPPYPAFVDVGADLTSCGLLRLGIGALERGEDSMPIKYKPTVLGVLRLGWVRGRSR